MLRRGRLILTLVGLLVLLFWPYFLEHRVPLNGDWLQERFLPWSTSTRVPSTNPELDDPIILLYPLRLQGVRELRQHELPLWNPDVLCGTPLFEDQFSLPMCPWNLLMDVLPPLDGWTWLLFCELLVGGVGMVLLLEHFGLPRQACLLGSVSFMLCSVFAQSLEWASFLGTYGWLPWMAWGIERMATGRRHGYLLTTAAIGLQFWCGMVQLCMYFMVATLLIMAVRLAQRPGWRPLFLRCAAALVVGLGLGVVVLLPTAHLLAATERSGVRYMGWSRPAALLTYIWPDIYGHPAHGDLIPVTGLYLLAFSGYIGLWSAVLVLTALRRESRRLPYQLLAAALPAYILVTAVPQFRQLLTFLSPGFFAVDHLRAVGTFAFAAAVLAAFGMADLLQDPTRRVAVVRRSGVLGIILIAAVLVLENLPQLPDSSLFLRFFSLLHEAYGSALLSPNLLWPLVLWLGMLAWTWAALQRSPRRWAAVVIVVVALDLLRGFWAWNTFVPTSLIYPVTPSLAWLQAHAQAGRILVMEPPGAVRGRSGLLPPNTGLAYGLQDVRGYESLWINRYSKLEGPQPENYFHSVPNPDWPVISLLGVRYLLSRDPIDSPNWKLVFQDDIRIYENQQPSPRAFVVSSLETLPADDIRHRLQDPGETRPTALWVEPDFAAGLPPPLPGPPRWVPASITVARSSTVVVQSDAAFPGYLVLADTMYDGWEASVDDRPVPVVTAYTALRAVGVPAGRHEVRFEYRPVRIYWSAAITLAALLTLLALAIRERRG